MSSAYPNAPRRELINICTLDPCSSIVDIFTMLLRPTFAHFAQAAKAVPSLTIQNNPYKAQKKWPPDFSKLPQTYQFNLERRYRRRSKLRYSNPRWEKNVKLTSYILCGGILLSYPCLTLCHTDWSSRTGVWSAVHGLDNRIWSRR